MDIKCIDPRTDPLWETLATNHPKAGVFNSPQWMRVLGDTYGFDVKAHVVVNGEGAPLAAVPFVPVDDARGRRIASLPFSDYCDPLVSDEAQWHALIDPILSERQPLTMRCLHNEVPLSDERLPRVNKAKWHGIDLQRDLGEIWDSLHPSARRAYRKAEKSGVTFEAVRDEEGVRAFFNLHLGVRKYKYRLLAQPYAFFFNIWRHLIEPGRGVIMLGYYKGEPVSAIMFLEWKDTLYYKFNASNPDYLNYRPNDLLLWHGIEYGRERGLKHFDFGLSDWDQEGLLRYKRKYATEEKTISFLKHVPEDLPQNRQDMYLREILPRLTDLFTEETVPDDITASAGDVLYRLFV
jgi:CelD/BcsL family acetyltransferase involved in cellulose biosynthesis